MDVIKFIWQQKKGKRFVRLGEYSFPSNEGRFPMELSEEGEAV